MLFRKLKKAKASPDGITAEVLQNMPRTQVDKLIEFVINLDENPLMLMPVGLRECEATLIPKKARPNMMKHLRHIAALPSMKKALGYRWSGFTSRPIRSWASIRGGKHPQSW